MVFAGRHGYANAAIALGPFLDRLAPSLAGGELVQVSRAPAAECAQAVGRLREVWILAPDAGQIVLGFGSASAA